MTHFLCSNVYELGKMHVIFHHKQKKIEFLLLFDLINFYMFYKTSFIVQSNTKQKFYSVILEIISA